MCFPCRFDSIRSCVSIVEILCFVLCCWRGVRFSYFSCHSQHSQARCASLNTFFASDHVTKFQRKKIHTHAMCNRWSVFDMIYNLKNIFESSFHCCVCVSYSFSSFVWYATTCGRSFMRILHMPWFFRRWCSFAFLLLLLLLFFCKWHALAAVYSIR